MSKSGKLVVRDGPDERSWFEPRVEQPRHTGSFGGVDHGSKGSIIAEVRRGNSVHRRLVWFAGHAHASCGVRGFGREYAPARLQVIDGHGYSKADITSGGRLSTSLLTLNADRIEKALGVAVAALLDHRRTFVIVLPEKTA